jgi:hypothetical protein
MLGHSNTPAGDYAARPGACRKPHVPNKLEVKER